ncbi:MAG: hypothetical protein V3T84_00330 [Phycisphaerales bacterium]
MRLQRDSSLIVLAVLLTGCNQNTVPQETASSTPPPPKVDDPRTASFVGLTAPKPVTWIEHPPTGSMRAANYTVPGRDGNEAAHIVVFYFGPTQGGTIDDNINRWRSQFQLDENGDLLEPKIDRFDVGSMAITLVELTGAWQEMGSASFTPDQVFLMAIVEAPVGKVFIRLAGQTATVEANREDFMAMIRGLRKTPT